jgi:prepilin peptidase CpaA
MLPLVVLFGAVLSFSAIAAYTDLRTGRIPNRLIAIGLLSALPLHGTAQYFMLRGSSFGEVLLTTLGYCVVGLVGCALAPLVLFRFDAMGGGDVKLLGTIGAFVGPMIGIEIELYAFVLIALYAGARLAYRGQFFKLLANSARLLQNPLLPKERRRTVPVELLTSLRFAPAVFGATLLLTALHLGFTRLGLE